MTNHMNFLGHCGLGVASLLPRELGTSSETIRAYRIRSPLKPISLWMTAPFDPLKRLEISK